MGWNGMGWKERMRWSGRKPRRNLRYRVPSGTTVDYARLLQTKEEGIAELSHIYKIQFQTHLPPVTLVFGSMSALGSVSNLLIPLSTLQDSSCASESVTQSLTDPLTLTSSHSCIYNSQPRHLSPLPLNLPLPQPSKPILPKAQSLDPLFATQRAPLFRHL